MEYINKYVEENKDRFLEELFGLIRIPSISSIAAHKPDMYKAAEYWKKTLLEAGADKAEVFETAGNPVTYGEKIIDPALPTVLVYGHMDVMPVDPIDLWDTPPFEPQVRDGKIYARGADDDKGQGMMHAKAFELMVKTNTLPCNVKFMIEGEEEVGSPNLGLWCEQNKEMLKADIILVSDTSMLAADIPSITTGLRGLAYWQVEVTGPNRDLHSGIFGGAVANPINVLCSMIDQMVDADGKITIPGFYDTVQEVSSEERALLAKAPFNEEKYKKALGVEELKGEKGFTTSEHTGIRPSFDVCGIWGGYTGEGAKTVLPSKAFAKISSRLVPDQDHEKIAVLFKEHFESIAPKSVKVEVTPLHGGPAYVCPIDIPAYQAAEKAYTDTFGKRPVPVRSGGSIPIISTFEKVLGIKSVLMGFGLESDAIHSPNENYPLEQFYKGIKTIPLFYKYFAEMSK
ncbi:Acetylornithine deacetylase/Succinyl-diaminopimelate desuccinylase [Draconibacterium orientale]|uniref:Acetylornithine deacetylase/Succinyl-diaminopimelate desuccinylase n=1 Tax=Draconibacterium orientale TaxID=1168034 RepID=X5DDX8_9BACT|nr:dipeptidase [Draconibacterium orientale]AHW59204.1 peptidase M20 [Draconibacterium orientale]SET24534.1 Acetylornithine deacetylase/Succinyl-diaminopimelate desuccinylase [Draconibacterium orientale]